MGARAHRQHRAGALDWGMGSVCCVVLEFCMRGSPKRRIAVSMAAGVLLGLGGLLATDHLLQNRTSSYALEEGCVLKLGQNRYAGLRAERFGETTFTVSGGLVPPTPGEIEAPDWMTAPSPGCTLRATAYGVPMQSFVVLEEHPDAKTTTLPASSVRPLTSRTIPTARFVNAVTFGAVGGTLLDFFLWIALSVVRKNGRAAPTTAVATRS
jgi:hypothetical protein